VVLAAGCGSIQDGFILAVDILASGNFITVGTMPAPRSAFLAAVQNLQNDAAGPEAREILIYSLASNAGGFCILTSAGIERALRACFVARLVFEWRIAIPGIGVLQALFITERLEPVGNAEGAFDLALRLAGKPEFIACIAGMPGLP